MANINHRPFYRYEKLKLPQSIRILELQPSRGEVSDVSDESNVCLII